MQLVNDFQSELLVIGKIHGYNRGNSDHCVIPNSFTHIVLVEKLNLYCLDHYNRFILYLVSMKTPVLVYSEHTPR